MTATFCEDKQQFGGENEGKRNPERGEEDRVRTDPKERVRERNGLSSFQIQGIFKSSFKSFLDHIYIG